MSSTGPGFRNQAGMRTTFRIVGTLAMAAALVLAGLATADFFATMSSDDMEAPSRFWMFFVALPCFAVGAACLQAGFGGAGLRYAAGEAAPVAKDTITYLGAGSAPSSAGAGSAPSSAGADSAQPRCPSCGTPSAQGARFCASCGAAVS